MAISAFIQVSQRSTERRANHEHPRDFQAQHAEHRAREALAQARSTLERALRELDRYTNRFEEAESLREKADVMNWTLNELACNITPNLRLDLIASAQAELVRADTME